MGSKISSFLLLTSWIYILIMCMEVHCDGSVELLRTPHAFSNRNSAIFTFQALLGTTGNASSVCTDCSTTCQLDHGNFSACEGGRIVYTRLHDGDHSFVVCTNGSVACAAYNWTIDRVNPTARITAATSFTSASYVPVNISFSEACEGGGGFRCSSISSCNLLVYGPGNVVPSTLNVIQANLKYSILVHLSERVRYGRLNLVMDKSFCTDSAGNQFTRSGNSSFIIHFDRRSVFVNLRTHIRERLLRIDSATRTVLATNKKKNLVVYLYFTEPVINSSADVLRSLNTSQGSLVPISGNSRGRRRFGYQLTDIPDVATVTVSMLSNLVRSRQGTPVASVSPVTFLYDSQRPTVKLSTTSNARTKEKSIPILIEFSKPVFEFNSSYVSLTGGHLRSFHEMTKSSYIVYIQADTDIISVVVPENVTTDVSGNRNRASNTLQVWHYSVPMASRALSSLATAVFALMSLVAGFLTVSTASLLSVGAFSKPRSIFCSDPARNLFRIVSHIQVFALSRWLPVTWPVEYYELARGLQWSVPYFHLPWEKGNNSLVMVGSSSPKIRLLHVSESRDSIFSEGVEPGVGSVASAAKVFGLPLTPTEYIMYFESHKIKPDANYILDPQNSHGWRDFSRSMFWLAIIGVSLILLHAVLILFLKLRKKNKEIWSYGPLIFPRFELFILILALPCFCEASSALIKGDTSSGMIVGVLILSLVAFLLLSLLLFLSFGITLGKLLQYKEIHQEGKLYHWYQEIIRVTLGPGKLGQWTWKNQTHSIYLTILGPLFEDLRGPPKYMLSQFSGSSLNKPSDRIIASDDETEDAEAPFIQKVFGILRIYYTVLEIVKRVALGIVAGAYSGRWSSRGPTIALLGLTSFQLFFMVLKKPFIKKKIQLVEIISVSCEVAVFAFAIALIELEFSAVDERRIGISLLLVFLVSFLVQMINEWYILFRQIKQLDPITNSFSRGLETSIIGFLLLFCPCNLIKNIVSRFPVDIPGETGGDATSSTDRNKSSGSRSSGDKPWLRRIRELGRPSLSSKEGSTFASASDPSSSKPRWNEFWKAKRSGSSSTSTPSDVRSRSTGLHKELENIFASK